jgi:hypothetical protein
MRNLETVHNISTINMEEAAEITALGFGRDNDESNYTDTLIHLESADTIQLLSEEKKLVAFAAYRRLLWQSGC